MNTIKTIFITLVSFSAFASSDYYPENVINSINSERFHSRNLLSQLRRVTIENHKIVLSYDKARVEMFNTHIYRGRYGRDTLVDVYCENRLDSRDGIKRGELPADPEKVNTEHTWPKDRFNLIRHDYDTQKNDLHHLYPADKGANSTRKTSEFGEVKYNRSETLCDSSLYGISYDERNSTFEPPHSHKGNVARAIFYFSTRYESPISAKEEEILRKWHEEDPVDALEVKRNDYFQKLQGNRNPYIDFPELVERISDF